MFSIKNPLPQQLRDTEKLKTFYRGLNLVPYVNWSAHSGHKFLKTLVEMAELSGTHGSCINDLAKWSFEGQLNIAEKSIPGLKQENNILPPNEEARVAIELGKYGVSPTAILKLTKKLFYAKKKTGNFYLRYKEVKVGETKKVFLEAIPPINVMYLNTEENEPKAVAISKEFFEGQFHDEPKVIRVYPDFSGTATERETVIHIKTEDEENLWYGRPDTLHVLYWMATEWFQALHSLKVTKTETISKAILALMNPDPIGLKQGETVSSIHKEVRVSLNRLTTNKGGDDVVDSIGVLGYPYNGTPPELLKLDINRDYKWTATNIKSASDYICMAHGWDKTLLGFDKAAAGIGGNVLIDTFEVKNTSTIKPIQRNYEAEPWGIVLGLLSEFSGIQEFSAISPRFEDRVESLVESLSSKRNGNTDNTGGSQVTVQN